MKRFALSALLLGATLLTGCMIPDSSGGLSFSENPLIDNNCSGSGAWNNPSYCTDTFRASGGPWAYSNE